MRLKHLEIVCDVDKLQVDLQQVFMTYSTIKHWAYIIHDKCDTRPHYHIYLNFGNSGVDTSMVASWFKIGENFISKVKGRKSDILKYLTHSNSTQQQKHQYNINEIVSNFDVKTEIEQADIIGNFEKYSYAQQLRYVNSLEISEKTKSYSLLEKLWKIECQFQCLNSDRNIDVVFITGKGGTGKTYYAKKFLEQMKYDYCISSASNDPFQDYLGQKAIILDDLRDFCFNLQDLLKILDNNTASSVKSRFANKVFNGKIIVITSSVPLNFWYKEFRFNQDERLSQLYRRINTYINVLDEEIIIYEKINNLGKPEGLGRIFKNEVFEMKKTQDEKIDISSIFETMCENIKNPF